MTDSEYVHLRIKSDTHQEVKILAAQLGKTHDETVRILLSEYHRHTALGRRFGTERKEAEFDGAGVA